MTYQVEITETLQKIISVDADCEDSAIRRVREMYHNEDVVLDYTNHVDTDISILKTKMSREEMFGCMRGKIKMSDDFNAPLDDFNEYMYTDEELRNMEN